MSTTMNGTVSREHSSGNGIPHDAAKSNTLQQKATASVLTEEMLARFASRAPSYDRDNRFMQEDFEELRASKYLLGPLPREFGSSLP